MHMSLVSDPASVNGDDEIQCLLAKLCEARIDNKRTLFDLLGAVLVKLPATRGSLWALSVTSRPLRKAMQLHLREALAQDAQTLSTALGVPLAALPTLSRLAVKNMTAPTALVLGAHLCPGGVAPCLERVVINPSSEFPTLRKLKLGPLLASRRADYSAREFTDAHALLVARVCARPTRLRELWLGTNLIGDVGGSALGAVLSGSSLERLDLTCNGLTDVGAHSIAEGLTSNRTLRHLHLDGNRIEDAGGIVLCKALLSNDALVRKCTLYLTANPLSDAGMAACRAAAKEPPTFRLSLL